MSAICSRGWEKKVSRTHGRLEGELLVGRLEVAVGEVGRQLELPLDVVGLLGDQSTTLELHRETKDVLSARVDDASQL